MPRRTDLSSVLVIGSGPIVIGQAAEFDYSGTQACRVLKSEGLRVILVNSNPATIMTDPELADATYVEPITPEVVEAIIAKERPDALLPTLGGQTALNTAVALHDSGVLEKYGVELIGAKVDAIKAGEDREEFKQVVERCGAESARSHICHTLEECHAAAEDLGYPLVVRPSFTMGGLGSGRAYGPEDLDRIAGAGLFYSPTAEVLLEESILGWKEFELELMRDHADNTVVVCSIENVDPVGVHTGDSITVAPALTLTDKEYQNLRNIGIAVIREVAVSTLLAPIMTPMLTLWLAGSYMPVDAGSMAMSIVKIVLVPIVLGLVIRLVIPSVVKAIEPILPWISVLGITGVVIAVIPGSHGALMTAGLTVFLAVILHNLLGYALGYLTGRATKRSDKQSRTMAVEVGMQNSGLAAGLAAQYFTPEAALPAAIFSTWHNVSGAIFAAISRRNPPADDHDAAGNPVDAQAAAEPERVTE